MTSNRRCQTSKLRFLKHRSAEAIELEPKQGQNAKSWKLREMDSRDRKSELVKNNFMSEIELEPTVNDFSKQSKYMVTAKE